MRKIGLGLLMLFAFSEFGFCQSVDTLWTRLYGRGYYDSTGAVAQTPDGGYIMVCGSLLQGAPKMDMYLVKADSLGVQEWDKVIDHNRYEMGHHVFVTSDGGFLISGETNRDTIDLNPRAWVVKTNNVGDTWEAMHIMLSKLPIPVSLLRAKSIRRVISWIYSY
jgi:hypothetical protein